MARSTPDGNAIDGVSLTPLQRIPSEGGAVMHMLRNDEPEFRGFGECYFSEVLPGAVKAWKRHRAQTQNLAVPVGRVRIVIFDDRVGSKTQGNVLKIELGQPDAYRRLEIPPGVWYGFACVGETSALLANCADLPHDPTEGEKRPIDDPRMPYNWRER